MSPALSIVIPVWGEYGGEPLREAVATLREQAVEAELIIVDNASDPPPAEIEGAELVRSPKRLTVGAARNLGLERVRAPLVLFWDADDLMLPGTLARLAELAAHNPGAVAVGASIMEDDPRVPHRWPRRWARGLTARPRMFALAHAVWSQFPTTGCTVMRTEAVRSAGGFADADSGEDWVLGVSLAFRGAVLLDDHPGRVYRRHPGSLWETRRTPAHLRAHARAVRVRMRADAAIPKGVRAIVPVLATAQFGAIGLAVVIRAISGVKRS